MSRYISVKWLEDNAKEYSLGYYDYDEYAVPLSALDEAPSIDIVRCKDCKYFHNKFPWDVCERVMFRAAEDDFCSYGEVR